MSNATKNLIVKPYGKGGRNNVLPVDGGTHIYEGTLVSQLTATNMLVPGSTASSSAAVGVATHEVDATGVADEALRCEVEYDRIFSFENGTAGDACSETTPLFSLLYMVDDHTVADNSAVGTRAAAGRFCGMNEDGTVRVFVGMHNLADALAAATDVSITDTGAFTTAANVEDALAEIYQHLKTAQATIGLSLHSFREVDGSGDVGAIAANGGLLASDTTPIMRADTNESFEISWATGNVDQIATQISLPTDFNGAGNVTVDCWVSSGTTDAADLVIETSWDGGAKVSDALSDTGTKSASIHKLTATIALADVPNAAAFLTLSVHPPAHATDAIQLHAIRVNYQRKILTS